MGLFGSKELIGLDIGSSSVKRAHVKAVGAEPAADQLRTTVVASIGPVTAEAAAQYGIQTAIVPAQYTVPALVNAIVEYVERRARLPLEARGRHPDEAIQ